MSDGANGQPEPVQGIPLHEPNRLPRREGITGGMTLTPDDGPVYHQARVSQAAGLKDLEEDYAFFSHGLLFTHGGWNRDPVADYVRQLDPTCCPFVLHMSQVIFQGLAHRDNPAWNYILMAVYRPQWDGLRSFLASLSGVDRDRKRYHRIAVQELPLVDVLGLAKHTVLPEPLPMTTVTLFALEGSWATVGFEPALTPPQDCIRVVKLPAEIEVVKLAQALFAEQDKPFQAIEPSALEAQERLHRDGRLSDVPPDTPGGTDV